jgi:hypothetical protein
MSCGSNTCRYLHIPAVNDVFVDTDARTVVVACFQIPSWWAAVTLAVRVRP